MTTPENFRRRQRIEGIFLVVLGVFVAASVFFATARDQATRNCLADQFRQLSVTLSLRGDLQTQESKATEKVLTSAATANSSEEIFKALNIYKDSITKIQNQRDSHPVPPYPAGTCE